MLCNERSHHNEKPKHCNWRVAPAHLNREKMPTQRQRPSAAKDKLIKSLKKKKQKRFKGHLFEKSETWRSQSSHAPIGGTADDHAAHFVVRLEKL